MIVAWIAKGSGLLGGIATTELLTEGKWLTALLALPMFAMLWAAVRERTPRRRAGARR